MRGGFVDPADIAEIASATGAMLVGRRTWDVGDRLEADEPGSTDYPFWGPTFLLTHRPLDPPDPDVTILSGDIGQAVATALAAAGIRFSAPGLARVQLEPISSARSGEATILRFRVRP